MEPRRILRPLAAALSLLAVLSSLPSCGQGVGAASDDGKVVVAYLRARGDVMPDPARVTHIDYAFAKVMNDFEHIRISAPDRLREVTALKKDHPALKVCLSIGGWGAGNFSEMAADPAHRAAFVKNCMEAVAEYDLDGIDMDWEYPTSDMAGISASPDDKDNFTLLMKELREALGPGMVLTFASPSNAQYVDFPAVLPYLDWVNLMSYDMGRAPYHNAPLYTKDEAGEASPRAKFSCDDAVAAHAAAGVPYDKMVLGMPLYGRGDKQAGYPDSMTFAQTGGPAEGHTEQWDDIAQVPYYADAEGKLVFGFDNEKSIRLKCRYALEKGLRGAMYWEYTCDDASGTLTKAVAEEVLGARFE